MYEYDETREEFRARATYGYPPEFVNLALATPLGIDDGATGQAAAMRAPVQVPDLRAVFDHIAKPLIADHVVEPWLTDLRKVASINGIHCKVSGMVTEADHQNWTADDLRPYVHHVLGLFGTVLGMIEVFDTIAEAGAGQAALLSSGISQALITTAAGLLVAIPSLVVYNFFNEKAELIVTSLERESLRVLRGFYHVSGYELPQTFNKRRLISGLARETERSTDLLQTTPWSTETTIEYILPPGHVVTDLPPPVRIDGEDLGFAWEVEVTETGVRIREFLELKTRRIAAERYAELREACRQVDAVQESFLQVEVKPYVLPKHVFAKYIRECMMGTGPPPAGAVGTAQWDSLSPEVKAHYQSQLKYGREKPAPFYVAPQPQPTAGSAQAKSPRRWS